MSLLYSGLLRVIVLLLPQLGGPGDAATPIPAVEGGADTAQRTSAAESAVSLIAFQEWLSQKTSAPVIQFHSSSPQVFAAQGDLAPFPHRELEVRWGV